MNRFAIQKLAGLTVLYVLIIVGIFALQFRNQSIFSRNFSQLRLTLTENKEKDNKEQAFDDSFLVEYKGISIFADENNKLVLKNGSNSTELQFINWKQIDDDSFELNFSHNVTLYCNLSGEDRNCMNISANLPAASTLLLPYKFSRSYTITDFSQEKYTLKSSNTHTTLSAPKIEEKTIELTSRNNQLSYLNIKRVKQFQYITVLDNPMAKADVYEENVYKIKNFAMNQFEANLENISENSANAYMAEMTEKNKYLEAIVKIPESYKTGSRRTFLSAPYLNNLVAMNASLVMQIENLDYKLDFSLEKQNLSFYETEDPASFILISPEAKADKILKLPASLPAFEPSVNQAAGILNTYVGISKVNPEKAQLLEPVLDACFACLEKASSLDKNILYISSNGERMDQIESMHIGKVLIDYGKLTHNSTALAAGYKFINDRIPAQEELDINFVSNIYSILQKDSTYIPHIQLVNANPQKPVWAWTVAQSIDYSVDQENTITITTKFPQGASHYMILNNIEPFKSIEIYGMKFRTDPRFETYNSSGYVYNASTKTLFLKYRHKSEVEVVRLFYNEIVEKPQEEIQTESTQASASPNADESAKVEESKEELAENPVQAPVEEKTNEKNGTKNSSNKKKKAGRK
ncbi:MAG: hypothetical protein K5839_04435 [Treponemataceae bacterium]|nr:hypothetical protein [Treponemataceae bacterium]